MSPLMIQALSSAEAAEHKGGLTKTRAGWGTADMLTGHYASQTVNALLDRGHLQAWGGGYCTITEAGRRALADWRSSH